MSDSPEFKRGDKVLYVGRGFPHLRGKVGEVVGGLTSAGFYRVDFGLTSGRVSRINPRALIRVQS